MVSVRPGTYQGKEGFKVKGSPRGYNGHPVSIFVNCHSTAVRLRKLLNSPDNARPDKYMSQNRKVDTLIRADARVKVCRR